MTHAFWLDWDYDRAHADNPQGSRYADHLHGRLQSFQEIGDEDPSVEFAATAWRIATAPIMDPGLVRSHARVSDIAVERSRHNGEMIADLRLVCPRPQALDDARTVDGDYFRDRQLDPWLLDRYERVTGEDLTRNSYLFTEARLIWQLPAGKLPLIAQIPADPDGLFRQAIECLHVLVWALNRVVDPLIERLPDVTTL